ncbi:nitroreductase family protein [Streptomyces sp. NPDC093248]|uniref:nitroreductase family protein n=1 Tax=Streptomyces sp. NPDC093248 TaxID=3155072 RepID=UPI00344AE48C
MTQPPNPVLEAVLTRLSAPRLTEPAPGRHDLERLIQAAATAPDHGRLRPWKLVAVTGNERARLGDELAEAAASPEQARRAATKPLRAPLLLSIVHCPAPDHPKVPE